MTGSSQAIGLLDHPVGVRRAGAGDHSESGCVTEVGLVGFAVVLDGTDPAVGRDADRDGDPQSSARACPHLGQLRDDLVERGVDEAVELDLAHRSVAT